MSDTKHRSAGANELGNIPRPTLQKKLNILSPSRKRIVVDQVEDELMDMQPQPPPEALEEAPQDETEEPPPEEIKERPSYQTPRWFVQAAKSVMFSLRQIEKELNLYKAERPSTNEQACTEPISGYQMTQVSQKLWKAWVLPFVYMLLMGGCKEMKPVSAAVHSSLNLASYSWQ